MSLRELIPLLSPAEAAFFTALDAELDKIEGFFLDREKEFLARGRVLKEQLEELGEHRRLFYVRPHAFPSIFVSVFTDYHNT